MEESTRKVLTEVNNGIGWLGAKGAILTTFVHGLIRLCRPTMSPFPSKPTGQGEKIVTSFTFPTRLSPILEFHLLTGNQFAE
jgi:hypothetical protein